MGWVGKDDLYMWFVFLEVVLCEVVEFYMSRGKEIDFFVLDEIDYFKW